MTDFSEAKGKICFFIYIKFYSLDILNISIITLAYIYIYIYIILKNAHKHDCCRIFVLNKFYVNACFRIVKVLI